jgi:hypothetical protein
MAGQVAKSFVTKVEFPSCETNAAWIFAPPPQPGAPTGRIDP